MEAKKAGKLAAGAWAALVVVNEFRLRVDRQRVNSTALRGVAYEAASDPITSTAPGAVMHEAARGPITDEDLGRNGMPDKPFMLRAWNDMAHYGSTGWSVMLSGADLQ